MESSAIALRFRDTTPGIDTIEAHRTVIALEGEVWWGWWKKDFEKERNPLLQEVFSGADNISILLVNRTTEKMYIANARRWLSDSDALEPEKVPEYYRASRKKVATWFLLSSITPANYDKKVAGEFGDNTFQLLAPEVTADAKHSASVSNRKLVNSRIASPIIANDRDCILYLSDLHFGADYGFKLQNTKFELGDMRKTLTECLVADLDRLQIRHRIGAIIVTGDFISRGSWSDQVRQAMLDEFTVMRKELRIESRQVVAVPGNHDIIRYPEGESVNVSELAVDNQITYRHEREFRTFAQQLVSRDWQEPLNYLQRVHLQEVDLLLCALNSCAIVATDWTEYGYVGDGGIEAIRLLAKQEIDRPTVKFLALHHHLLPVSGVEALSVKGVSMTLDASRLLEEAQMAGVHVAVHGHQHLPKISQYRSIPLDSSGSNDNFHPLFVVANGSAGVKGERLPVGERNTYSVFRLSSAGVELWLRELRVDGKKGSELFGGRLDILPSSASCIGRSAK